MYTIQFLKNDSSQADKVRSYLIETLSKDGRFKCEVLSSYVKTSRSDRSDIFNKYNCKNVYSVPGSFLKKIRLNKAKPYCGNHPGECLNPFVKKPVATYLEWDDWVAFHSLVNKVLNKFKVYANVWTLPFDVKGKMWIRKGLTARKRYEFNEESNKFGQIIRIWNPGDDSQFC